MTQAIMPVPPVSGASTSAALRPEAAASGPADNMNWGELMARHASNAQSVPAERSALDPENMGQRILEAVDGMRQDYQRLVGDAHKMLEPGPAAGDLSSQSENVISHDMAMEDKFDPHATAIDEIREMLSVQLDMGRMMVHEQLMSSTAGRGNQSLDTLLRGQ